MSYGKNDATTERGAWLCAYLREYEIGGKKYTVVSHYVGKKNVDNVLREIAVKRAYSDMENKPA